MYSKTQTNKISATHPSNIHRYSFITYPNAPYLSSQTYTTIVVCRMPYLCYFVSLKVTVPLHRRQKGNIFWKQQAKKGDEL